jgi:hypothetical protein
VYTSARLRSWDVKSSLVQHPDTSRSREILPPGLEIVALFRCRRNLFLGCSQLAISFNGTRADLQRSMRGAAFGSFPHEARSSTHTCSGLCSAFEFSAPAFSTGCYRGDFCGPSSARRMFHLEAQRLGGIVRGYLHGGLVNSAHHVMIGRAWAPSEGGGRNSRTVSGDHNSAGEEPAYQIASSCRICGA